MFKQIFCAGCSFRSEFFCGGGLFLRDFYEGGFPEGFLAEVANCPVKFWGLVRITEEQPV